MSANLEAKKVLVEEIKEKIQKSKTIVFVDYRGVSVLDDTKLRAGFRANGAEYKVYKNRLMIKALEELGITGCEKFLEGTNAVGFGYNDEVAVAKLLTDASKAQKGEKMIVKFGIVDGKVVDAKEINTLATIPSREVLVAKLLSMLTAPVRGLAVALSEIAKKQN